MDDWKERRSHTASSFECLQNPMRHHEATQIINGFLFLKPSLNTVRDPNNHTEAPKFQQAT
jgi:hypothetical protein